MKQFRTTFLIVSAFMPLFVFAQSGMFDTVLGVLRTSLNVIIGFLFLVATVIFLYGVIRYIAAGGDEDKVSEARNMIIWGIIFLAVMIAVWGFVYVVLDFVFNGGGTLVIPGSGGSGVPQQ